MNESDRFLTRQNRHKFTSGEFKHLEDELGASMLRWLDEFSEPIVASYAYTKGLNPDRLIEPLTINAKYAERMLAGYEVVPFIDGTRALPAMRKIRKLAEKRLLKALVLRDPSSFGDCTAADQSRIWREITKAGAELHFSEDSPVNAFLNFADVSQKLKERQGLVSYREIACDLRP